MTTIKRPWGRILTRGKRFWIAYYAPRGGRRREVRESAGGSLEAADKLLERRRREVLNDREGVQRFAGPKAERIRVEELLGALVADYEARGLASAKALRSHRRPLVEGLGGYRAVTVTRETVFRYIRGRRADGIKDSTIDKDLDFLRAAWNLAVREGVVPFKPSIPRLTRLHENARQGFLSAEQFGAIQDEIQDQGFRDFLWWFWFTGWRPREIGTLTWAAYDKETQTVTLPARSAKIKRARRVPVVGPLVAILERRQRARRLDKPEIFHSEGQPIVSKDGGLRAQHYRSWWEALAAAQERIPDGWPETRPVIYDLRRSAIRNLLRAGVGERTCMEISGHLTRSTFDRYTIVTDDLVREAFRKLGAGEAPRHRLPRRRKR